MLKFKIIIDDEEKVIECNSLQLVEMLDDNTSLYLFDSEIIHELYDDEERG